MNREIPYDGKSISVLVCGTVVIFSKWQKGVPKGRLSIGFTHNFTEISGAQATIALKFHH